MMPNFVFGRHNGVVIFFKKLFLMCACTARACPVNNSLPQWMFQPCEHANGYQALYFSVLSHFYACLKHQANNCLPSQSDACFAMAYPFISWYSLGTCTWVVPLLWCQGLCCLFARAYICDVCMHPFPIWLCRFSFGTGAVYMNQT